MDFPLHSCELFKIILTDDSTLTLGNQGQDLKLQSSTGEDRDRSVSPFEDKRLAHGVRRHSFAVQVFVVHENFQAAERRRTRANPRTTAVQVMKMVRKG